MDTYLFVFDFLKINFALIALTAIFFDYLYHKDMKLILYAYLSFFIGSIFVFIHDLLGSYYYIVIYRLLAVVITGIFFALCTYLANKKIISIKEKTQYKLNMAFKK